MLRRILGRATATAFLALAVLVVAPTPGEAQRIVAVVNDGLVTDRDLEQRLRLSLLFTGQAPTEANAARLRPQVLRALIDEQLQLQEAERLGVTVDEAQVDAEIERIAQSAGLTMPQMLDILERAGVREATLRRQLRSQLLWVATARRQLLPRVVVSDVQVAQTLRQASRGETEYRIAEIFLPIYDPADEAQVLEDARRLREAVIGGADFEALARQVSTSPSAERGGDLGWLAASALPGELRTVVAGLADGAVSQPVRTQDGVYLFRRVAERAGGGALRVSLRRIDLPVDAVGDDALTDFVDRARTEAPSCPALETLAMEVEGITVRTQENVDPAQLAEPLSTTALTQPVGVLSDPMRTADGTTLLMVCGRDGGGGPAQREQIVNRLRTEALERLAQRYLRNLRQDAFIDVRLGQG